MQYLSNEQLSISIAEKGAELQSIRRTDLQLDYLWSGDAAFWGKKSPVLFPIVGGLKNNQYTHQGKAYQLGRHGFARDQVFEVSAQTTDSITFTLRDSETSLAVYPFPFQFSVRYQLSGDTLAVSYIVKNTGDSEMWFSVGAHPAFKLPLTGDTAFDDYYLQFSDTENTGRWPLSPDGLIELKPGPLLENTRKLALNKPMFYADALVLKHMASDEITIKSDKHAHGVTMRYDGFPFFGIWSAKDADFLCLEPWCGIADAVNTSGELSDKEGIIQLSAGDTWAKQWSVKFF
ncbi:aldose 1-epimerase family protein [Chitinophaga horti]|uniref:Aldose 1-epimerase family protein n=1 Tax=Chitinophaga horti TaxID=2920382 RepID=A0ABY6IUH9_9BACT|nr:aldose 1-epimerase family protein [Chitinophaga horti]UYQ91028.1 aldose 1-epimerase family protein [Chitinophaga horti]